jgi:uncharacterized protein (DUF1697 family)
MPHYVALVRGITATNPNCRNAKIVAAFAAAGCSAVTPVIASGNFIFRSASRRPAALAAELEQVLADSLGLSTDVFVLSRDEIAALVAADPFPGRVHGPDWYLTVTFRKDGQPPVCTATARADLDGPALMQSLERRLGRRITTRTWNTMLKILAKLPADSKG